MVSRFILIAAIMVGVASSAAVVVASLPDDASWPLLAFEDEMDSPGGSGQIPQRLVLAPPPPPGEPLRVPRPAPPDATDGRKALAYQFNAPIFEAARDDAGVVGFVRRNTAVPVLRWVAGSGCGGSWYEVHGGGYVCNTEGFVVDESPTLEDELRTPKPRVDVALPFRYAKVSTPGAPRFWQLPTPSQEKTALSSQAVTDGVQQRLDGAHFVAVAQSVADAGREFIQTIRGRYLRADDVELRAPPRMRGVHLRGDAKLPLAFVHVESAPLFSRRNGSWVETGVAQKHARFAIDEVRAVRGRTLVLGANGFGVPRKAVRLVRPVQRPDGVPADSKWIHVDLGQQSLVAYEGDEPVFATLVSTGKKGYEPPLGVFRVHKKYLTRTMSGEDEVDGSYEVDQVPWTMYYWGSYALHGAYWHDDFGTVKSHGCTNIPPADARWLFRWSPPELPYGWHGVVGRKGAWVYFT